MRRGVDSGQKVPLPDAYKTSKPQNEYPVAPPMVSPERYEETIPVLATSDGRLLVTEDGKAIRLGDGNVPLIGPELKQKSREVFPDLPPNWVGVQVTDLPESISPKESKRLSDRAKGFSE